MTKPAQKVQERALLEHFLTLYPVAGELDGDGEKPDFVVRGARAIGIEVRDLYIADACDPLAWQRQRPRRLTAISLAQNAFVAAGGQPFDYHFDLYPLPGTASPNEVAAQVLAAARAAERMRAQDMPRGLFNPAPLVRWLVRSESPHPNPRWEDLHVHAVPVLDPANIQKIVRQKGEKLNEYRPCDEQWLLIGADFWDAAQDQEITWPKGALLDRCGFDRVFIVKTHHSEVLEPPSTPPGGQAGGMADDRSNP